MMAALDREWWDSEGRCQGWPPELKDKVHSALVEGFNAGMTTAPCRPGGRGPDKHAEVVRQENR